MATNRRPWTAAEDARIRERAARRTPDRDWAALAADLGRTHAAVRRRVSNLNAGQYRDRSPRTAAPVLHVCEWCGAEFDRKSRAGRLMYCSPDHALAAQIDIRRCRAAGFKSQRPARLAAGAG